MAKFKERSDDYGRPLRSLAQLRDRSIPYDPRTPYAIDNDKYGGTSNDFVREWQEACGKRALWEYSPAAYTYFEQKLDLDKRNINVQVDSSSNWMINTGVVDNLLIVLMDKDLKNSTMFSNYTSARNVYRLAHLGYRRFPGAYGAKSAVPRIVGVHLIAGVLFLQKQEQKSTNHQLFLARTAAHEVASRRRKLHLLRA